MSSAPSRAISTEATRIILERKSENVTFHHLTDSFYTSGPLTWPTGLWVTVPTDHFDLTPGALPQGHWAPAVLALSGPTKAPVPPHGQPPLPAMAFLTFFLPHQSWQDVFFSSFKLRFKHHFLRAALTTQFKVNSSCYSLRACCSFQPLK